MPECRQSGRVSIGALNGLQHSLRRRVLNEPTAIPKTFRHPFLPWRFDEIKAVMEAKRRASSEVYDRRKERTHEQP